MNRVESRSGSRHAGLVSVIVPTYNRVRYLQEAVRSVFDQTYAHWELLVVDDGSTDETLAYLSTVDPSRVRVVELEHTGNPARVRNAGLACARGDYVAFLDSDDLWHREKLRLQMERFLAGTCRWGYTRFVMIDERGREIPLRAGGPWRPYSGSIVRTLLTTEAAVAISSVVAERRLLVELGGFDEDPAVRFREDYDLFLRLASRAHVIAIPETLCRVREHPGWSTSSRDDLYVRSAQVYEKFERSVADPSMRRLCRQRAAIHLVAEARRQIGLNARRRAIRILRRAFRYHPLYARWWVVLARCMLPPLLPSNRTS